MLIIFYIKMLKITNGGNLFSSTNCRLEEIIWYFNKNHRLPEKVDTSALWRPYKTCETDDLADTFFKPPTNQDIPYTGDVQFTFSGWEHQFSDYAKLNFAGLKPFVDKYFQFADTFERAEKYIINKYNLNPDNLACVMLRGNDKWKETNIPPYEEMINKAKQVAQANPGIRFLVQTDEKEFLDEFLKVFPGAVYVQEIPLRTRCRDNSHSSMPFVLPRPVLLETTWFFGAVVKIFSKSKYIITTSGNGEMWFAILRGNAKGIYQYLSPKEYIYGVHNKTYDPKQTNFWIEN
jgi:hypothetical protein